MDQVLGVFDLDTLGGSGDLDVSKVDALIEARLTARDEKEWARADEIRDELLEMGVAIKDGPEGTTWSRIVQ
jgi:cysteinyl-tRNA synthetase